MTFSGGIHPRNKPSSVGTVDPHADPVAPVLRTFDEIRSWRVRVVLARHSKSPFDPETTTRAQAEIERACRPILAAPLPPPLGAHVVLAARLERAYETLTVAALAAEVARCDVKATEPLVEALTARARQLGQGVGFEKALLPNAAPETSMAWKGLAEAAKRCDHPSWKDLEARSHDAAAAYAMGRGSVVLMASTEANRRKSGPLGSFQGITLHGTEESGLRLLTGKFASDVRFRSQFLRRCRPAPSATWEWCVEEGLRLQTPVLKEAMRNMTSRDWRIVEELEKAPLAISHAQFSLRNLELKLETQRRAAVPRDVPDLEAALKRGQKSLHRWTQRLKAAEGYRRLAAEEEKPLAAALAEMKRLRLALLRSSPISQSEAQLVCAGLFFGGVGAYWVDSAASIRRLTEAMRITRRMTGHLLTQVNKTDLDQAELDHTRRSMETTLFVGAEEARLTLHENAHAAAVVDGPAGTKRSLRYRQHRETGEKPRPYSQLVPNSEGDFLVLPTDLAKPYGGRVYTGGHRDDLPTEMESTALEDFYDEAAMLWASHRDPKHFAYGLGYCLA